MLIETNITIRANIIGHNDFIQNLKSYFLECHKKLCTN